MTLTDASTYADISFIYETLADNTAGDSSFTVRLEANLGNAKFETILRQFSLAGEPYYVMALPVVNSLSTNLASALGGKEVTLSGKGLPTSSVGNFLVEI